jgi:uncharacterized ferritin-like protein (DUF455 family)
MPAAPHDPPAPRACARAAARAAWDEPDPRRKAAAAVAAAALAGPGAVGSIARRFDDAPSPGRPARPRIVPPRDLPKRGSGSALGRATLLHAIAHIELNAIDLALDAVWRFADLPDAWYGDWLLVAGEEAAHFTLLADELERRGYGYGAFDAHAGLWEMALRTRGDPLARVALVPRLMEARGLDVTPGIQARLARSGDPVGAALLQRILDDEVGHVAIGNRWYRWLCARRGLDPLAAWDGLAAEHGASRPRPPFNVRARLRAGFTAQEIRAWSGT